MAPAVRTQGEACPPNNGAPLIHLRHPGKSSRRGDGKSGLTRPVPDGVITASQARQGVVTNTGVQSAAGYGERIPPKPIFSEEARWDENRGGEPSVRQLGDSEPDGPAVRVVEGEDDPASLGAS